MTPESILEEYYVAGRNKPFHKRLAPAEGHPDSGGRRSTGRARTPIINIFKGWDSRLEPGPPEWKAEAFPRGKSG